MNHYSFSQQNPRLISWVLVLIILIPVLLKSENPEWIIYNHTNSILPYDYVNSIAIDSLSNKWFGTQSGLAKLDIKGNWTSYTISNAGLPDDYITSLAVDSKNNIWIGFRYKGIAKFDNQKWTFYNKYNSGLKDNEIQMISIDKKDNIWIGTSFKGLNKFDGVSGWAFWDTTNSVLPHPKIYGIDFDENGTVWISSFDYLLKFDGDTSWSFIDVSKIKSHWYVKIYSIKFDKSYNLWLGNSNFISKFDRDTTWTIYQNNFTASWHYTLAFDNANNLWYGSESYNKTSINAIVKFDGDTSWARYGAESSPMPDKYVRSIAIDKYGNNWIGTFGGGVAVYREGGVVGVNELNLTLNKDLSIYPNPVTTSFSLSEIPDGAVSYEIFDNLGINILSGFLNGEINVSGLSTGVYFLKLNNLPPVKFLKI